MGPTSVPFLTNLYLYSHEVDCKNEVLKKKQKKRVQSLNFMLCYIGDATVEYWLAQGYFNNP